MPSLATLFARDPHTPRSETVSPSASPAATNPFAKAAGSKPASRSLPASPHAQALPPRSSGGATAAGALVPRDAALGLARWKQDLQRWCDADPHRARSSHSRRFACLPAWGRKSSDDLPLLAEQRETAMQRVLECHAQGADGRSLDLKWLSLSSLPPGLDRLPHLETLDLSNNIGLFAVPEELARCQSLRRLAVRNGLVAEVPSSIFQLPNLEILDLSANPHLMALPDAVAQAPRLRTLQLSHCNLSRLPEGMANMPALQVLDVSHNLELHALPPGLLGRKIALSLQGTPVALMDSLLQPLAVSPAQRAEWQNHLAPLSEDWQQRQPSLQPGGPARAAVDRACSALSLQLRTDRMDPARAEAAWADANAAVQGWLSAGLPITRERLVEIGWRMNGRPSGGPQLRAVEVQAVPAGPHGFDVAVAEHLDHPRVGSLPGHLDALEQWLGAGSATAGAALDAVEHSALLYRALVSLRPFDEGSAPAALMAMDWALQRQGLPPVTGDGSAQLAMALAGAAFFPSSGDADVPEPLIAAMVQGMQETARTASGG
ncbi:leucine-rich repeat domain-containing protein [Paracidovorax valerianellae]|uniref:Leucine rich repeat-containing protein n=1 Tax=Paracidovorax valerianellae TaxID=187868 RepID=A0A1G6S4W0_9BURK|nr:leucine-rich repeat domain-containing protein [Paracidovorax valerianellae]MDA8444173.1 leucine-rich repeat domain-containing protein [Paracidovorax valerianellae]SDD11177.1 Leucine rich repeat-containing protein [Paracidovorax valerianellae]